MSDESQNKQFYLPQYAVDALVKAEMRRTAVYENESRERLEYIKEDVEMRRKINKAYTRTLWVGIYQTILFTVAFLWWILK